MTTGQRFDFTLFGAVGTGHSEAFAGQVLAEHVRQFPIIIDKQYGCHGSTLMGDTDYPGAAAACQPGRESLPNLTLR